MYAIRQIQMVENGTVVVHLPHDFPANQVEIIVLPLPQGIDEPPKFADDAENSLQRLLNLDISAFTEEQRQAYLRTCHLLRRGRAPGESPIFGLFANLIDITDDFDAPLPDEILDPLLGKETDEYGMSLQR